MTALSRRDLILVLIVAMTWGIHAPIIRLGVLELDPFFLAFLRFTLSALIFLPFAPRPDRSQTINIFFVGLFFLIGNLGFNYLGLNYITANSFVVIAQIGQAFALILAYFLFGERFGVWTALGIGLAFMGVMIVFGAPDILEYPLGALSCLCGAFFWSLGSVWMKKVGNVPPLTFLGYANLMMIPIILSMTLIFEHDHIQTFLQARPGILAFVLTYQVLLMGLMMLVWQRLMHRNPAQLVTPFLMLQPFFAVTASYFLLGETLNDNLILGGAIVIAGIGVINWRQIHKYMNRKKTGH